MKIFLFSDLHGSYKYLEKIIAKIAFEKPDAIIFAGDLVNTGEPVSFVDRFIEKFSEIKLPFLWIPGNNDFGRAYYHIQSKIPSLEGKIIEIGDHKFTGVGGSPASWAGQYAGENLIEKNKIGGTIFVSHVPPPGVHNYSKVDQNIEAPNKSFKDAPLVHICGHLHHQWGVAYLGQTKIIKLPSANLGIYAILDLPSLKTKFKDF